MQLFGYFTGETNGMHHRARGLLSTALLRILNQVKAFSNRLVISGKMSFIKFRKASSLFLVALIYQSFDMTGIIIRI